MPFTPDWRTLGLLGAVLAIALISAIGAVVRPGGVSRDATIDRLARAGLALVAATWFLLVFGASVRVNGAGLSCPDWPRCYGELVPALDWKVSLEYFHRVWAGGVSIGFVSLFAAVGWVSWTKPELRRMLPLFGLSAAVLATQIVLGGLTVLHLLAEWTVASHLVCGNAFACSLALIALLLRERAAPLDRPAVGLGDRVLAGALLVAVFAQLALGGLVSSSFAGLACGTWPSCNGGSSFPTSWFPTLEGAMGLQVMHRITAYTILALAGGAALLMRGSARKAALAVVVVALAQATLGVANVLLHLPVEVTLLHTAGAAALALAVTRLNVEAWLSPIRAESPALSLAEAR